MLYSRLGGYNPSPTLRAIQIALLTLIVFGICLLITQKIWVPKLVSKIIGSEYSAYAAYQ